MVDPIKDITDGISVKLNQVFGNEYEIYGDTDVVQDLTKPCFFIAVLRPSQTQKLGKQYFRVNPFDIQYFPKYKGGNGEMHRVAAQLFEAFEFIELLCGDLLRGTEMWYEIVDGVLHFFVNFNISLYKETEEFQMETAELDIKPT